jgi:Tol biopolymer transport system component
MVTGLLTVGWNKETGHLWLRDLYNGETKRLTNAACNNVEATWSADSKTLVYASDCGTCSMVHRALQAAHSLGARPLQGPHPSAAEDLCLKLSNDSSGDSRSWNVSRMSGICHLTMEYKHLMHSMRKKKHRLYRIRGQ